jgi:hypothetical protein
LTEGSIIVLRGGDVVMIGKLWCHRFVPTARGGTGAV